MKTFGNILKILAILAAIAGIIYVVATYGERIVAWAKKALRRCEKDMYFDSDCCYDDEEDCCEADFAG